MQRELRCACATKSSMCATSSRCMTYLAHARADWVCFASNVVTETFVSLWHILGYKLARLRNNSELVSCGRMLEASFHICLTVVCQSFSRMPMPKMGCTKQKMVCSALNLLLLGLALLSLKTPAAQCSEVCWNSSFYALSIPSRALGIHISATLLESNPVDHVCLPQSLLKNNLSCGHSVGARLQRVFGPGKRDHIVTRRS